MSYQSMMLSYVFFHFDVAVGVSYFLLIKDLQINLVYAL